jgi:hypothetical protein
VTRLLVGPLGVLALVSAFAGWGALLAWAARRPLVGKDAPDAGLLAAWGMALLALLGGFLDAASLLSRPLALGVLALGWASAAVLVVMRARARAPRGEATRDVPTLLLATLLAAPILLTVVVAPWVPTNPHDDNHAYLAFSTRMLQTGSLGAEPFSVRRLISGLGGQYFLNALTQALLGVEHVQVLERGASLVACVLVAVGHARALGAGARGALLVVALLVVPKAPIVNVSSLLSGVALLWALVRTLPRSGEYARGQWALLLVLAAGLSSLKGSWPPVAGLVLIAALLGRREWPWRRRGLALVGLAAGGFVLLLPWMLSLLDSSGTMFFPFLGRGFHGAGTSTYVGLPTELTVGALASYAGFFLSRPTALACLVPLVLLAVVRPPRLDRADLLVLLALWASAAALVVASVGTARYTYPSLTVCLGAGTLHALSLAPKLEGRARVLPLASAAAVLVLVALGTGGRARVAGHEVAFIRTTATHAPAHPLEGQGALYAGLQEAVGDDATLLAYVTFPFRFDYRRQRIYNAGAPCGAMPPPGFRCLEPLDPVAAARALCTNGVTHVAYSYADQAGFSTAKATRQAQSHPVERWRVGAANILGFQQLLAAWESASSEKVFDDGRVWAVALECDEGH